MRKLFPLTYTGFKYSKRDSPSNKFMRAHQTKNSLINKVYNKIIRPILPTKIAVYNGVAVKREAKLLDINDVFSDYKAPNAKALRNEVRRSDDVIVIGGGVGVTSIVAARNIDSGNVVLVYEASEQNFKKTQENISINEVDDRCQVKHAIVGSVNPDIVGLGTPEKITAQSLSDCDVLEMDCEGSELNIIKNLQIGPRTIIVETHPKFGSPTNEVENELSSKGYIISNKVTDPVDGHVLTAKLK